jgi:hypothetical protein
MIVILRTESEHASVLSVKFATDVYANKIVRTYDKDERRKNFVYNKGMESHDRRKQV